MQNSSYYWYKQSDPHEDVFAFLKHLENEQSGTSSDNLRNMRLYGNSDYANYANFNAARVEPSAAVQNRVTFNVVQSMVDTAHSKITKNKPRPYFLTDGGNWSQKRRAQKLTQFMDGAFYTTDYYRKASQAFKDACIFGTGVLKIFKNDNQLMVERVFIDEIVIDNNDAVYGKPRQIHQKKFINREVLISLFPKSKFEIEQAVTTFNEIGRDIEHKSDMALVVESWKLPSKTGAKDGKHTICVNNKTLFQESWTKNYFPFVFFKWNERPLGFFGQGIAEQLTGIQLEMNKILRTIQISMHLVSVPKIFIEASSKIITSHLNNKIGGIVKFAGSPPIEGKLGTVPAELFSHLDRLYQRAYSIIGISQLSAQAQKPQGLNSGKALRTYNDIETERFTSVGRMYEDCALEASKMFIDSIKEIAAETGNFSVKSPGSQFLSKINWSEVEMSEDDYIMQCFPVSALSNDPASRMQEVQELVQSGFMDKTSAMKLLDYPDLRAYYDMANASVNEIERQIELIIDKQEYSSPEPYQNLTYGIVAFQNAYLMYKSQGAPEEVLDLFRRWIEAANDLIKLATAPAVDPLAAQPTAVPQAPPQSELLPNVPAA
jgi:hypothetical protein